MLGNFTILFYYKIAQYEPRLCKSRARYTLLSDLSEVRAKMQCGRSEAKK